MIAILIFLAVLIIIAIKINENLGIALIMFIGISVFAGMAILGSGMFMPKQFVFPNIGNLAIIIAGASLSYGFGEMCSSSGAQKFYRFPAIAMLFYAGFYILGFGCWFLGSALFGIDTGPAVGMEVAIGAGFIGIIFGLYVTHDSNFSLF